MPQAVAGTLPFVFFTAVTAWRYARGADRPRALIDGFLALAIVSDLGGEIFGHFGAIAFPPFLILWGGATLASLAAVWRHRAKLHDVAALERPIAFYIVAGFAAVTLLIALTAAPNNWDSQTYHLARIEHWAQDRSLGFYPTAIARQNAMGPLAELILLQTRILSGGDFFYPLVQWLSMVVSVATAFRVAKQLGGNPTQCWLAAVFVATLPIGVLESTSTQNDYVEAALLAGFVSLGLEAVDRPLAPLGLVAAAAAAGVLSGMVKPVAFMVGVGFACWFAVRLTCRAGIATTAGRLAVVAAIAASLAGPFTIRLFNGANLATFQIEEIPASFGVGQTLDTLLRHTVSDLVTGIPPVDQVMLRASDALAGRLGLSAHRADTTDLERPVYIPPKGPYIYQEDYGPNQPQTILVILALASLGLRWPTRPTRRQLVYCGAWVAGLLVFGTMIRFGMWQVRYHLPGFVLAGPIVALRWPERGRAPTALIVVLAALSSPVLILNKSRELVPLRRAEFPLLPRDQPSYLTQTPAERLFANRPELLAPYRAAADAIVASGATEIGLVLGHDNWEYPIWWLLRREGVANLRIEHVLVPGASAWPLGSFAPKVVFWDRGSGEVPETITVGGAAFRLVERQVEQRTDGDTVAVFSRVDPR